MTRKLSEKQELSEELELCEEEAENYPEQKCKIFLNKTLPPPAQV